MVATYTAKTHVFNSQELSTRLKRKRDEAYTVLFVETDEATKKKVAARILSGLKKNTPEITADLFYKSLHVTGFNPRTIADIVAHNTKIRSLVLSDIGLVAQNKTTDVSVDFPAEVTNVEEANNALSKNAAQARARLQKLFTQDTNFAYQFFADWKLSATEAASLTPAVLSSLASTNPGAALGMLINPALVSSLENALFNSETIKQMTAQIATLKSTVFHLSQRIKDIKQNSSATPETDRDAIVSLSNDLQKAEAELYSLKVLVNSAKEKAAFILINAASQSQEKQRHYFPVTLDLMLSNFKDENKKYVLATLKTHLGNNTDDQNPIRDIFETEIRPDLGRVLEKHFDVFVELASDAYQNSLSKLLFHSPDPVLLLARLLKVTEGDNAFRNVIADQAVTILTTFFAKKAEKEFKNSFPEQMLQVAKPLVIRLINAYAHEKTAQRADQLTQLFANPDLLEALKISDTDLRKVSQDANFVQAFSHASLERSSRKKHPIKSWFNQRFNVFAADFVRPAFALTLTEKEEPPRVKLSKETRDQSNFQLSTKYRGYRKNGDYILKSNDTVKLSEERRNQVQTTVMPKIERAFRNQNATPSIDLQLAVTSSQLPPVTAEPSVTVNSVTTAPTEPFNPGQIVLVDTASNQTQQRPVFNVSWKQFQRIQAILRKNPIARVFLERMFPAATQQKAQTVLAIEGSQKPAQRTQPATAKTITSALSPVIVNPRKPLSTPVFPTASVAEIKVEKVKVEKPAAPKTPEQVRKPAAPVTPEAERAPSLPDRIEEPVTPVKKPNAPVTPEAEKPAAPVTPIVSTKPAAPVTPVTKPAAPQTPGAKPVAPQTPETTQTRIQRLLLQPGIRVEEPVTPVAKPAAPITPPDALNKPAAPVTPPQSGSKRKKPAAPKTPNDDENTRVQYGLGKKETSPVARDIFGVKSDNTPTMVK